MIYEKVIFLCIWVIKSQACLVALFGLCVDEFEQMIAKFVKEEDISITYYVFDNTRQKIKSWWSRHVKKRSLSRLPNVQWETNKKIQKINKSKNWSYDFM